MSEATVYVGDEPVGDVTDFQIQLSANVAQFNAAIQGVTAAFRKFSVTLDLMAPKLRAFARLWTRRRRSGHRHRGTRDWQLRYAPARKDLPLGQRTLAKKARCVTVQAV